MSTRRRASVRESVEARGTAEDVEMQDQPGDETADAQDADAEGEMEDEDANESGDMYHTISELSTFLCEVEEDGEELASGFQRIPNRRVLPDYFEVISSPVAFSTIRQKLLKKQYTSFTEFVRDVAQICHNAQVYNRPSAPIFTAAEKLREVFKTELGKLVAKGVITTDEAILPDLGELPPAEDSPPPMSDVDDADVDEEEEEEEEEDEDEDEEDDSDDDGRPRRRRGRGYGSTSGRRDRDDESHKKRGRPPSVMTPMEARISSLLRGLRKFKGDDGSLLILPFEKLPDKAAVPDYYTTIMQPIALDQIKRKAKRKKYANIDAVMADINLMFANAKRYNEDDSPVFAAANELQEQAHQIAAHEKARPDDDFRDEDGKLPLAEIQYNGQSWRVGDWVHIRNPNDLTKPIVAQIYRTWQDRSGQRWINACWYYRPEQTVHRYEKHFFEHEVVKTGQYRDHQIEEVLERCFVMFVTRFNKGRPRGFPPDKSVYVCESRYNEEKFSFAKIKTWASCVPDEVRERDYEMDLFDVPRRMKKIPSPIKHLLRDDAKETDALPKPTWGSPNAPPIVGAVHRRPREANESPPPEPTPPPQSAPHATDHLPDTARRASMMSAPRDMSHDMSARGMQGHYMAQGPSPSPSQYHTHMAPHFQVNTPMQQTPVPVPQPQHHLVASPQAMRPAPYQQAMYPQSYAQAYGQSPAPHHQSVHNPHVNTYHQLSAPVARPPMQQNPSNGPPQANMYNPPRPPEVYTLPDTVNDVLDPAIRQQFQHDDSGRVLFFTTPPIDRPQNGVSPSSAGLGHSARYLAGRSAWLAERELKRKARNEEAAVHTQKRASVDMEREMDDEMAAQAMGAMGHWLKRFDSDTKQWEKEAGLDGWQRQPKDGETI
ncbi:bromodomain-containing protein [Sarocladium implicatum]|nr:bromodomain-containing protein [Sarocladium implicatum]